MIPKVVFDSIGDAFGGLIRAIVIMFFIILALIGLVIYLLVR
jgi:hypothetical protein